VVLRKLQLSLKNSLKKTQNGPIWILLVLEWLKQLRDLSVLTVADLEHKFFLIIFGSSRNDDKFIINVLIS